MIPLLTTIPRRIRNPVRVFAFIRLLPDRSSANREPMAASGIENSSTKGVVSHSKADANIMNISMIEARIRNLNSLVESSPRCTSRASPEGRL